MKAQVRARARGLCEYCHAAEQWQYVEFTVAHVVPVSKGGSDAVDNLALACFYCNRRKWNATVAVDSETGEEVPLFNPIRDGWQEHFVWSVDRLSILGVTAIGRATVEALQLNRERILSVRAVEVGVRRHPPMGESIQEFACAR